VVLQIVEHFGGKTVDLIETVRTGKVVMAQGETST